MDRKLEKYAADSEAAAIGARFRMNHDLEAARRAETNEEMERYVQSARDQLSPYASLDAARVEEEARRIRASKSDRNS